MCGSGSSGSRSSSSSSSRKRMRNNEHHHPGCSSSIGENETICRSPHPCRRRRRRRFVPSRSILCAVVSLVLSSTNNTMPLSSTATPSTLSSSFVHAFLLNSNNKNNNENGVFRPFQPRPGKDDVVVVLMVPTLTDWSIDRQSGQVTGIVQDHPVVPDGEVVTTASAIPQQRRRLEKLVAKQQQKQQQQQNSGRPTQSSPLVVVTTIKGTKYRLDGPPLIPSSSTTKGGGILGGLFANNNNNKNSNGDKSFQYRQELQQQSTQAQRQQLSGYFYSTALPYDDQLRFLDELTSSLVALQDRQHQAARETKRRRGQTIAATTTAALATTAAVLDPTGARHVLGEARRQWNPEKVQRVATQLAGRAQSTTRTVVLPYLEEQIARLEQAVAQDEDDTAAAAGSGGGGGGGGSKARAVGGSTTTMMMSSSSLTPNGNGNGGSGGGMSISGGGGGGGSTIGQSTSASIGGGSTTTTSSTPTQPPPSMATTSTSLSMASSSSSSLSSYDPEYEQLQAELEAEASQNRAMELELQRLDKAAAASVEEKDDDVAVLQLRSQLEVEAANNRAMELELQQLDKAIGAAAAPSSAADPTTSTTNNNPAIVSSTGGTTTPSSTTLTTSKVDPMEEPITTSTSAWMKEEVSKLVEQERQKTNNKQQSQPVVAGVASAATTTSTSSAPTTSSKPSSGVMETAATDDKDAVVTPIYSTVQVPPSSVSKFNKDPVILDAEVVATTTTTIPTSTTSTGTPSKDAPTTTTKTDTTTPKSSSKIASTSTVKDDEKTTTPAVAADTVAIPADEVAPTVPAMPSPATTATTLAASAAAAAVKVEPGFFEYMEKALTDASASFDAAAESGRTTAQRVGSTASDAVQAFRDTSHNFASASRQAADNGKVLAGKALEGGKKVFAVGRTVAGAAAGAGRQVAGFVTENGPLVLSAGKHAASVVGRTGEQIRVVVSDTAPTVVNGIVYTGRLVSEKVAGTAPLVIESSMRMVSTVAEDVATAVRDVSNDETNAKNLAAGAAIAGAAVVASAYAVSSTGKAGLETENDASGISETINGYPSLNTSKTTMAFPPPADLPSASHGTTNPFGSGPSSGSRSTSFSSKTQSFNGESTSSARTPRMLFLSNTTFTMDRPQIQQQPATKNPYEAEPKPKPFTSGGFMKSTINGASRRNVTKTDTPPFFSDTSGKKGYDSVMTKTSVANMTSPLPSTTKKPLPFFTDNSQPGYAALATKPNGVNETTGIKMLYAAIATQPQKQVTKIRPLEGDGFAGDVQSAKRNVTGSWQEQTEKKLNDAIAARLEAEALVASVEAEGKTANYATLSTCSAMNGKSKNGAIANSNLSASSSYGILGTNLTAAKTRISPVSKPQHVASYGTLSTSMPRRVTTTTKSTSSSAPKTSGVSLTDRKSLEERMVEGPGKAKEEWNTAVPFNPSRRSSPPSSVSNPNSSSSHFRRHTFQSSARPSSGRSLTDTKSVEERMVEGPGMAQDQWKKSTTVNARPTDEPPASNGFSANNIYSVLSVKGKRDPRKKPELKPIDVDSVLLEVDDALKAAENSLSNDGPASYGVLSSKPNDDKNGQKKS